MTSSPLLQLQSFAVSLGSKKVLRSIQLELPARSTTVIVGPSGTGKSTLLRTLAGLNDQNPSFQYSGSAKYLGQDIFNSDVRPALVSQNISYMVSNVLETLLSNLPNRSRLTRLEQLAKLEEHCKLLGQEWLLDHLQVQPTQLAYHEQKILFIVRESLTHPELLMLDEPTANISDEHVELMNVLIASLAEHCTLLIISHHLAWSQKVAQYIALMANGIVEEFAPVDTFFSAPKSELTQVFLRTGSCPELSAEVLDQREEELIAGPIGTLEYSHNIESLVLEYDDMSDGDSSIAEPEHVIITPQPEPPENSRRTNLTLSIPSQRRVHYRQVLPHSAAQPHAQMLVGDLFQAALLTQNIVAYSYKIALTQYCEELEQTWILDCLDKPFQQLQSYEKKIVTILADACREPLLLVLDDPTVGIDEQHLMHINHFILRLAERYALCIVSPQLTWSKKIEHHITPITQQLIHGLNIQLPKDVPSIPNVSPQVVEPKQIDKQLVIADEVTQDALLPCHPDRIKEGEPIDTCLLAQPEVILTTEQQLQLRKDKVDAPSHFMGPRGFVWTIKGRIAGTPWPGIMAETEEDLGYLKNVGINHLISLTEAPFPQQTADAYGIKVLHFPIIDMQAPTIESSIAFCHRINYLLLHDATLAVHCKAGLGRTGTMLAVYYLWLYRGEKNAQQAIAFIRALNAQMIQSQAQVDFLEAFAKHIEC